MYSQLIGVLLLILRCGSEKFPTPNSVARRENEVLKEAMNTMGVDNFYYKALASDDNNEGEFDEVLLKYSESSSGYRDGEATAHSSCDFIRGVPDELRSSDTIGSSGISSFYQKYTEAYGIPVLGSSAVLDSSLSRACYVLRFLLADRLDLRQAYYSSFGRVAVIGRHENIENIPEYGFLDGVLAIDSASGARPTRGLGAVELAPVSTGPEENLLCYSHRIRQRVWFTDDVLLKTLAIGILNLAAVKVDPKIMKRLDRIYKHAVDSGWWSRTDAARGPQSYFGEGVQSFFDVNAYAYPADGYNNDINTRTKLRSYDTALYGFVQDIFPCANNYMKRCNSRGNEAHQRLWTNCPSSGRHN